MPECHKKFTQIASGMFRMKGISWVFTQLFLLEVTGLMPLTLCECASHRFCQTPPSWTSLINVTFKSISVLRLWLVLMNSFATTLLHVRIPCSKNCSLFSVLDFPHTSSIILLTKTLIRNQFIQLIHLFPHSIRMI